MSAGILLPTQRRLPGNPEDPIQSSEGFAVFVAPGALGELEPVALLIRYNATAPPSLVPNDAGPRYAMKQRNSATRGKGGGPTLSGRDERPMD